MFLRYFSKNMKIRAQKQIHEFGKNLTILIADHHDIIVMKCATDRLKDEDDVRYIIESKPIDWSIIIDEARTQKNLGEERAILE